MTFPKKSKFYKNAIYNLLQRTIDKYASYNINMDYTQKEFLESRPQRLCKMCGKCCRVLTASISYEELKKSAEAGDKSSIEFLDTFEPYPSLEDALKADEKTVKNIPDYQNRTFYRCKHIGDSNLCPRYEVRYDVCRFFPSSPWAVVPPECGFEGWLFQQREFHKQHIRKLKEEAIFYKAKLKTNISEHEKGLYEQLIKKINERVKLYDKYDSEKW